MRLANGPDAPVPGAVIDGMTQVLARWREQWIERPTVIVPIPSTRHPEMVRSLAAAIGELGRLPVIDALGIDGVASESDMSAKARAQVQGSRLSLLPGVTLDGQTVLLVDDAWRTGWTATIAGALLREAGADHVLPLVVHQRP